jgi:hypothetical protein
MRSRGVFMCGGVGSMFLCEGEIKVNEIKHTHGVKIKGTVAFYRTQERCERFAKRNFALAR